MHLKNFIVGVAYVNNTDALVPENWARMGLAILENNMVAGKLVHRDFENTLAKFGDVVNTRKPREFEAIRKVNSDDVTDQDAILDNIPVTLNQHIHTTFVIKDGEESLAMQSLVQYFMLPAMIAQAKLADQILLGQYAQFMDVAGTAGGLGTLTATNAKDLVLELGELQDTIKAPEGGRSLIVPPHMKALLLSSSTFTDADKRGDQGTALRNASMGHLLGYDFYMCQQMASVLAGNTTSTGAINNGNITKGSTVLTVDGITGVIANGTWLKLAGLPYRVTAHSETLGNTTSITLHTPLRKDTADNAVITFYTPGAVNLGAGYAAGWVKSIVVDGFTVAPKRGQIVTFANQTTIYTIVGTPTTTSILLDRPLVTAIVDNDPVNIGPGGGDYAFAIASPLALALVSRPLALPIEGAGAHAAQFTHNGFSMRAVITYDGKAQGHRVTLDMLLGVAVLDTSYGAVLAG